MTTQEINADNCTNFGQKLIDGNIDINSTINAGRYKGWPVAFWLCASSEGLKVLSEHQHLIETISETTLKVVAFQGCVSFHLCGDCQTLPCLEVVHGKWFVTGPLFRTIEKEVLKTKSILLSVTYTKACTVFFLRFISAFFLSIWLNSGLLAVKTIRQLVGQAS